MHRLTTPDCQLSLAPVVECGFPVLPVIPGRHSVFIRTLPRYLTLPLRHAPTCHGNGREPDELTEHHRTHRMALCFALFIPFLEVMNKK